jgi:hypothetical protein
VSNFDEVGKLGSGFASLDELEEMGIGDGSVKQPTYVNTNLPSEQKVKVCDMLWEFVDCFAWNYTEMSVLSQDLVEHLFSIKPGFRPYKQPARNFNPEIVGKIKEEVDRLLQAKFVHPCRYVK